MSCPRRYSWTVTLELLRFAYTLHLLLYFSSIPLTSSSDHIIPRRHPLGPRVGGLRRRARLPTLRYRCRRDRRCMANPASLCRSRPNHPIPRLYLPLLRRCPCRKGWLGTELVRHLSICADFHRRCIHCCIVDRPRSDCGFGQQASWPSGQTESATRKPTGTTGGRGCREQGTIGS